MYQTANEIYNLYLLFQKNGSKIFIKFGEKPFNASMATKGMIAEISNMKLCNSCLEITFDYSLYFKQHKQIVVQPVETAFFGLNAKIFAIIYVKSKWQNKMFPTDYNDGFEKPIEKPIEKNGLLTIEYCKDGNPISDFDCDEWLNNIKKLIGIIDFYVTVSTSIPIDAIRLAIANNEIDCKNVRFKFNDQYIYTNEYGAILNWANGFANKSGKFSEDILRAAINKKKK